MLPYIKPSSDALSMEFCPQKKSIGQWREKKKQEKKISMLMHVDLHILDLRPESPLTEPKCP